MHISSACDICGDEIRSYIGDNYLNNYGAFHVFDSKNGKTSFYICSSCAEELMDYAKQLREEYTAMVEE